jgi:hypothetical protein
MATKRLPRPRDPIQLGKLMVDIATGQVVETFVAHETLGEPGSVRSTIACSTESSRWCS